MNWPILFILCWEVTDLLTALLFDTDSACNDSSKSKVMSL